MPPDLILQGLWPVGLVSDALLRAMFRQIPSLFPAVPQFLYYTKREFNYDTS